MPAWTLRSLDRLDPTRGSVQQVGSTTQQPTKDISAAKQMIDLLGMLEEKTKDNLTEEEESLLRRLLLDLRLRYVGQSGR